MEFITEQRGNNIEVTVGLRLSDGTELTGWEQKDVFKHSDGTLITLSIRPNGGYPFLVRSDGNTKQVSLSELESLLSNGTLALNN